MTYIKYLFIIVVSQGALAVEKDSGVGKILGEVSGSCVWGGAIASLVSQGVLAVKKVSGVRIILEEVSESMIWGGSLAGVVDQGILIKEKVFNARKTLREAFRDWVWSGILIDVVGQGTFFDAFWVNSGGLSRFGEITKTVLVIILINMDSYI